MFLFINSVQPQCGVYQYGKRLYQQLNDKFEYVELGSEAEYRHLIENKSYDACILNYHPSLFSWWKPTMKTFYLYHESDFPFDKNMILNTDPTHPLGIPRPLYRGPFQGSPFKSPSFGSFGFGFSNKGFERIVKLINEQYNVATIRLLIPYAYYGDADGAESRSVVQRCKQLITKPNIKLLAMHDFLPDNEIVSFLASNDLNLFLYDHMPGRGCSSVIDYAIAARRPIAISDSVMFRHIYSDSICAYKRPLQSIIADGTHHIDQYLEKWKPSVLCETILNRIEA